MKNKKTIYNSDEFRKTVQYVVLKVCIKIKYLFKMREWLRGGAPPCQGGGRGFESRLALFYYIIRSLKLQDFRLFLYCLIY